MPRRDVLQLLAPGYMNQDIGKRLDISVRTVNAHRAHIMRKLGLETRAELVLFALGKRSDRSFLTLCPPRRSGRQKLRVKAFAAPPR